MESKKTGLNQGSSNERIYAAAALFKGDFSIDWLQEITQEKPSLILQALDRGLQAQWLTDSGPGLFHFADQQKQKDLLEAIPSREREDLFRRVVRVLNRELPDEDQKDRLTGQFFLHVNNDLSGCRRLVEEGNYYRRMFCHKEALRYYEKALEDLQGLKGETAARLMIETSLQYSKISTATLDADRVHSTIRKALQVSKTHGYHSFQAILKMVLAKHEWLRSDFQSALKHFDEGWTLSQEIGDPDLHRSALIFSMFFHYWQGRFQDAVESYEKYMPEIEKVPKGGFPLLARLTIGNCYGHCGQVSQAMGMLDALRSHCLEAGNIGDAGHASTGIGLMFSEIGYHAKAFHYFEKALKETVEGQNHYGRLAALLGLAQTSNQMNDYQSASIFLHDFLDLSQQAQMYFRSFPVVLELCWSMEQGLLPRIDGLSLEKEINDAIRSRNIYMRGMGYRHRALVRKQQGHPRRIILQDLTQAVKWLEISGHQIDLARVKFELAREYLYDRQEERARIIATPAARLLFPINEALIPDDLHSLVEDFRDSKNLLKEILNLSQEMVTLRDNREVAVRIVSAANSVTGAERGAMFLLDESGKDLTLRAAINLTRENLTSPDFSFSMRIIKKTFNSGRSFVLDLESKKTDIPVPTTIRSVICVPMTLRNKIIGVLYHDNRFFQSVFRKEDLEVLGYFAAQAAIAMENAQAYDFLQQTVKKQQEEKQYLEEQYLESLNFEDIIGKSRAVCQVFSQVDSVAGTEATVLILGETGVGKELVARAIHHNSARRNGPFVRVNCSVFSENLITSELFGHEKGAFTGAGQRRIGRFELANRGTIFLDEIGEIPLEVQVRLLRVLQSKEFERVGGQETVTSDFRLMAATNRDLQKEVINGRFRKDLFYRLNVFPITVPPLRERREDIPLLAYHFLFTYAKNLNKKIEKIPESEMRKLIEYDWPGNVRELENVIERGVILSKGPYYYVPDMGLIPPSSSLKEKNQSLEENERIHILKILELTKGRVRGRKGAAAVLQIHPNTLYSRMKKLGIFKSGKD